MVFVVVFVVVMVWMRRRAFDPPPPMLQMDCIVRVKDCVILVLKYFEHEPFADYMDKMSLTQIRAYIKALMQALAHVVRWRALSLSAPTPHQSNACHPSRDPNPDPSPPRFTFWLGGRKGRSTIVQYDAAPPTTCT